MNEKIQIGMENIVSIISAKVRTGKPGDCIIYVTEVKKVYKVSNGLENEIN